MLRRKKFLIGGVIIAMVMAYLGYTGFQATATYYYTVREIEQQANSINGEIVRVNGIVASDSLERESQGTVLKFVIVDTDGEERLPVIYRGVLPDTFKVGAEVVAEGYLTDEGIFQANIILAKCPSKYEPQATE